MTDVPLQLQLETAQQELRNVYRERAHLVALLASMYPASMANSDPDTPEWPVVTVETRAGQMSWHIAPDDVDLFGHLDPDAGAFPWDGHSTEDKYARVRDLTKAVWQERNTPSDEPEPEPEPEPEQTKPPRPAPRPRTRRPTAKGK